MGFPTETQVIASAKALTQKEDGSFVRTNGLWHVLMFLRLCACKNGLKQYEFQAQDLAQAAFDLNGIKLPIDSGARNAYFEPGATQGKEIANLFRHHDGPRQTYLNRIYSGLAGAGPKQPKLFNVSSTHLPTKIELTEDWVQNLRSHADNQYVLDERIHELITWIFRFGIPQGQGKTAYFTAHSGNGNLSLDANVLAATLPSTHSSLVNALANYFSLSPAALQTLLPELKNVRIDEWDGLSPINIGTFGPLFLTELVGATTAPVAHSSDFANIVRHFTDQASSAKLIVSQTNAVRLVASLLAKRFAILTGLSGSGKTKLAEAFAAWISESKDQYCMVAVGADWTTNENVLGYQDALQDGIYRKPSNGALDLILRAGNDSARPYFLILDEMNLSHVERYFADILSAIESTDHKIALHSAAAELDCGNGNLLKVPHEIRLPDNLFIIGTVNVDETTYMFSPKVLDRANVIEFRATAGDIAAFFDAPSSVNMKELAFKGVSFGQPFVTETTSVVQLDAAITKDLKERLTEVFNALAPIGAEFGFRTAHEITRFTYFHSKLSGNAWQFEDALDAQVLQKLMPKLHGSERKLGPVLEILAKFCGENNCVLSLEKIKRMQHRLRTDGFTSYAEA